MVKVKEFEGIYDIDKDINDWLSKANGIEIIDIKYSTCVKEVYNRENIIQSRALVIYKEGNKNE